MNGTEYKKRLPVDSGWDVVIVGGGPAGAAAALTTGRSGLKTIVIEAGTRIGGMGTGGMVSSFAPMSDGRRCVAGGIAEEIIRSLYERGATGPAVTPRFWEAGLHQWVPFKPEELALLWDELLDHVGVTVRFGSRVVDAENAVDGISVSGVIVADVEGLNVVRGRVFVDATGDASLAAFAGFPTRRAGTDTPNIMPPTLCALFSDIQWDRMQLSENGTQPLRQQELLEKAIGNGMFTRNDKHLPGLYRIGNRTGMMNAGHLFKTDAVDRTSVSNAYRDGRRVIRQYMNFYREHLDGCREMELVSSAPYLGVRESRRIQGEYLLDHKDYRARRRFHDGIGLCAGSIDIHVYDDTEEEYRRYFDEFRVRDRLGLGESFGIPYRSLLPKSSRNMWVAGRCISADVKTQGALRIQPAAMVMGQAVGTAATVSLETGKTAQEVDVASVRRRLLEAGAVLE